MGCCGDDKGDVQRTGGDRRRCVLCRIWKILTRGKTAEGDPCVVIPGHLVRKPDPCIYSQFMLMQLNQPVTWDNPDVRIFLGAAEQYTYNLTVATDYQVEVTVHNSSRDKPALGTQVAVRWIEFGAGAQTRHDIAFPVVDVPVWPGIATVTVPWRTPDTPGHYCLEVELAHPNDGNPANNRGWNNTQVHAAASPVARPIRIFNNYPGDCPPVREGGGPVLRPHRVLLGWGPLGAIGALMMIHYRHGDAPVAMRMLALFAAGYLLAVLLGLFFESAFAWIKRHSNEARGRDRRKDRTDCHLVEISVDSYEFEDKVGKDFDPAAAFQGKAPVWPATVDPSSFVFLPGEAYRDVELRVDAPDGPGPSGRFNVNVRQGGVPSGGITVTITTGG